MFIDLLMRVNYFSKAIIINYFGLQALPVDNSG